MVLSRRFARVPEERQKPAQRVINADELECYLSKGYRFRAVLPKDKILVEDAAYGKFYR